MGAFGDAETARALAAQAEFVTYVCVGFLRDRDVTTYESQQPRTHESIVHAV